MTNIDKYTIPPPRMLPVILMADISGSMAVDGKIDALNLAVQQMISDFAGEDAERVEIQVAVITFGGGGAKLHMNLTPSRSIGWTPLVAAGTTPLCDALHSARKMIEDKSIIPGTAYRPTLILISDGIPTDVRGQPTDNWRVPLAELIGSERGSKADRFAMAIGADADMSVLGEFVGKAGQEVFRADEGAKIRRFFQWVTMTVSMRSRQMDPNAVISADSVSIAEDPGF